MTDNPRADSQQPERLSPTPGRATIRTALITTNSGSLRAVEYVDVGGLAVVEGDIILGSVDDVDAATASAREESPPIERTSSGGITSLSIGITGDRYRWRNGEIPYEIDPNLPDKARITGAIAHWEQKTDLRFYPRTDEANWVYFMDRGTCQSAVGMQGGLQVISLGQRCTTGSAIHEIGHAVGLWHEQSRSDRDRYISINWQNIDEREWYNFRSKTDEGDDIGPYDYESIMHYSRDAFSNNGRDTIVPLRAGATIGQRDYLSTGDIAAVRALYPFIWRTRRHFGASDSAAFSVPSRLRAADDTESLQQELQIQLLEVKAALRNAQTKASQWALEIGRLETQLDDLRDALRSLPENVSSAVSS